MRTRLPRNGLIVKEVIDAIKTDPDIDWVRHSRTGNKTDPVELWIPSIKRWVRPGDGYISGAGAYVYARWLGRILIRRAIRGRIIHP